MSPTERIILTCRAWHRAARLLRERCQRLRANHDTLRKNCSLVLQSENAAVLKADRLQAALASANERCNRIQADGNALADQLHAWRQACQDHGIEATPEALQAALRRVDAACVADAPRCHDCGRAAERVDGRWEPRCWCVGFADELAEADL